MSALASAIISTPVRCLTFVGRARELAHLHERLELATSGKGSVVLVRGSAGIGKTRLIREFAGTAAIPVFTHNVSPYLQHAYDVPLQLASAILKSKRRLVSTSDAARTMLENILAPGASAPGRRQIFDAVTDVVRAAARKSAIALVCEDVQWCDPDSVDLLLYLCERVAPEPVLIVLSARDETRTNETLVTIDHRLSRLEHLSRVRLLPMDSVEIRRVIAGAAAARGGIGIGAQLRIEQLASGNPYFAEELTREFLDSQDRVELPDSVAGAIKIRVDRLEKAAAEILGVAACLGPEFDEEIVQRVSAASHGDVASALQTGMDAQLIERIPNAYRFQHALAREVLYQRQPLNRRREVHRSIAEDLESQNADIVTVAEHWYLSGDSEKMYDYAAKAGERINRRYAYLDAALWFERARDAAPDDSKRAYSLDRLSTMYWRSGRLDAGRDAALEAAQAHNRAGEVVKAADSAREAARLAVLNNDNARGLAIARDGLRYTDELETVLRLRHVIAYVCAAIGDIEGARAETQWMETIQMSGDEANFSRAAAIATTSALSGEEPRWRAAVQQRHDIVERAGEAMFKRTPVVYINEGWEALRLGLVPEAKEALNRALELVRERRDSALEQEALAASTIAALHTGDAAQAAVHLHDALRVDVVHEHNHHSLLSAAAWFGAITGEFEAFDILYSSAVVEKTLAAQRYFDIGPLAGPAAIVLSMQGRTQEARSLVDEAAANLGTGRFSGWTLTAVARFGSREAIEKARTLLLTDRPSDAAFAALFAGFVERDRKSAQRAAQSFQELDWPYF
jgi:tetratricopeptide (TPR) repeat protein